MKKIFNKEYLLSNRGCYSENQSNNLYRKHNTRRFECFRAWLGADEVEIPLSKLYKHLPLKDFCWFFAMKTNLTQQDVSNTLISMINFLIPIVEDGDILEVVAKIKELYKKTEGINRISDMEWQSLRDKLNYIGSKTNYAHSDSVVISVLRDSADGLFLYSGIESSCADLRLVLTRIIDLSDKDHYSNMPKGLEKQFRTLLLECIDSIPDDIKITKI